MQISTYVQLFRDQAVGHWLESKEVCWIITSPIQNYLNFFRTPASFHRIWLRIGSDIYLLFAADFIDFSLFQVGIVAHENLHALGKCYLMSLQKLHIFCCYTTKRQRKNNTNFNFKPASDLSGWKNIALNYRIELANNIVRYYVEITIFCEHFLPVYCQFSIQFWFRYPYISLRLFLPIQFVVKKSVKISRLNYRFAFSKKSWRWCTTVIPC